MAPRLAGERARRRLIGLHELDQPLAAREQPLGSFPSLVQSCANMLRRQIREVGDDLGLGGGCTRSGHIRNRIWFTLRAGRNPHASLQAAWLEHGDEAFTLKVLERVENNDNPARKREEMMKKRLQHWLETLQTRRI